LRAGVVLFWGCGAMALIASLLPAALYPFSPVSNGGPLKPELPVELGSTPNTGTVDCVNTSCPFQNESTAMTEAAPTLEIPPKPEPFWGFTNGKPMKIRTMASTGPFSSGKSLLGDMIDPFRTFKIDIESSSTTTNLPFKRHVILYNEVDAASESGIPTALECFLWFRDRIKEIKPDEYTVVSVDPINEIQQGCYDWIYANPKMFNRSQGQYDKMSAMVWGDVKTYLDQLIGQLSPKIETFYYTLHMGQKWRDGKPVEGARGQKAKGSDVFRKMADVLFVLSRPVDPATGKQCEKPIGVVSGDIGKSRLCHANPVTGEVVTILPPAVHDLDPDKIREYIANPPNYKKLKKSELLPSRPLTEDERLELKHDIAELERDKEQMTAERIAATARRQEENARLRSQEAAQQAQANTQPATTKAEPTPTAELPTQKNQNSTDAKDLSLSFDDRVAIIKEGAKTLWGDDAVPKLKESLAKRNAAKFSDLGVNQVIEMQNALSEALSRKAKK